MIVFKGFGPDLACTRGSGRFQYKIGETATAETAQTASSGLHACKEPFGVLRYYSNFESDRYCICEAAGDINEDGDHRVSSTLLTPLTEITPQELALYEGAWLQKHPSLPYSKNVDDEEGTDNGYFAVVRGKNPTAHAITKDAVIILLQEFKTKNEIKKVAIYPIERAKDKGWYDIGGKREKGRIKKAANPQGNTGNHKQGSERPAP